MSGRGAAQAIAGAAACAVLTLLLAGCERESGAIHGSGTIEAEEVTISARTAGELLEVPVDEGERMDSGELMARIDATALELELGQLNARRAAAQARLDLLLAGAPEEDIRQARASAAQAEAAVELARKSLRRFRELFEADGTSQSALDRAESEYEQARSQLEAANARLAKLQNMPRPEEVRSAEAQLEEARAAAARLQQKISETEVRAPRAGTVLTRMHNRGEYVAPGTPLFRVADLSTVELTIYVPEPSLSAIRVGQEASVTVDGAPGQSFPGRVSTIAEEAEFTPKNVQTEEARAQLVYAVTIALDNGHGVFKIGMPAEATLARGGAPAALQ